MASITIRDIDARLKTRLRVRAAHHGRPMEEEARDILPSAAIREPTNLDIAAAAPVVALGYIPRSRS
jgi:antitoxin FitA